MSEFPVRAVPYWAHRFACSDCDVLINTDGSTPVCEFCGKPMDRSANFFDPTSSARWRTRD